MNFELISPTNTKELLSVIRKMQKQNFRLAAGCTDLLMELKKNPDNKLTVVNLMQVKDPLLTGIKKSAGIFRLGAGVTAAQIVNNAELKKTFPVLHDAAINLASSQIREVATIGGNMCTASPSGDIACALVALNAECEILSVTGKKKKISVHEFFKGPRKNALAKNEILYGIYIPVNEKKSVKNISGFIKVGTRKSMECSVVSLAYHIQTDENSVALKSGFAIGASAPVIRNTFKASDFLAGKNISQLTDADHKKFADKVVSYASPITDIRATAWYRKLVLFNISKGILEIK